MERRQSKSSVNEPTTPMRSSFTNQDPLDVSIFSSGGVANEGLGNLADELADALSDDGDYDEASQAPDITLETDEAEAPQSVEGQRDSGVDVASPTNGISHKRNDSLSAPAMNGRGHRRPGSEYDGSEYGSESDLDSPGIPPSLVSRIDAIESLARRGAENTGGPTDGVFKRVTDSLRDLGSQSGVEGGATRLITAHSALTTYLNHQTRQIQSLTYPLLSPLTLPPDPETIDDILPLLLSLSESVPRPSMGAYNALNSLHAVTYDLVQTLNYLTDTLQMSRQTTAMATRRLKTARDLVTEMKVEEELREEGERWLSRGNWGERLKRRECAHVCHDVVGGFEKVCDGWRARLLAQAESTPA
jgi:hypothetical protein